MNALQNEQLKKLYLQNKRVQNASSISLKKLNRVKSVYIKRENNWNDRFIYNKIPEYDSSKDKNVRINLSIKSYSGRRDLNNIQNIRTQSIFQNKLTNGYNSLNIYSPPLSNKTTVNHKNGRNLFKISSAKMRDLSFNNDNNLKYINMINLNNINKLWDELCVGKSYRNLFCVIYKELNDEDKQEIYQKEINELISIKNEINNLKSNIDIRLNTIKELSELNNKLNNEVIKNNNNQNENIVNEISKKIEILRENTINVCLTMKKLKYELNGIKNLDKYDIDLISEKYDFDKNYIIKMKGELNFVKEGFIKYYFNIEKDQTPFLLEASENCIPKKNNNEKSPKLNIVPLNKEMKNSIIECIYYIYQELIAYQNEKVNKNILKRISPLKRTSEYNSNPESNKPRIINGKEENNNINNNNLILKKSSSAINNLRINEQNLKKNIVNIKDKYIYSKKKFLNINKNGNNLFLNQIKSQRNKNDNKNLSIGLKFKNPLIMQNNFPRKSEINKKKNIIDSNINQNEKNKNYFSEDNNKIIEDDKIDTFNNNINENNNKNEIKK